MQTRKHTGFVMRMAVAWALTTVLAATAGAQWDQEAKVLSSDGEAWDLFGSSVDVSASTAIIGAPRDDDKDVCSGAAYVFRPTGSDWSEVAKLVADDGQLWDEFGGSVAISGSTAIVGAHRNRPDQVHCGAAYVFEETGSGWQQVAKLVPDAPQVNQRFGNSVDISGGVAIVGAWYDDDGGDYAGSAYIFEDTGSGWRQTAKLLADRGDFSDYFGCSVAVCGSTAVVGALGKDWYGRDCGAVYIFQQDTGSVWGQRARLLAQDASGYDRLGTSVGISGSVVIAGAPGDDDNGQNAGSAYIFRHSDTGWQQVAKLLPADGAAGDEFASSVAIDGSRAVVGARLGDAGGEDSGSAYIFEDRGSGWREVGALLPDDATAEDWFGCDIAASGTDLIVGACRDDDSGEQSGSAYIFIPEPATLALLAVGGLAMIRRRQ